MRYVFSVFITGWLCIGCGKIAEIPKEDMVKQEVNRKVEDFKKNMLKRCYESTLQDARYYVDSLVSAELSFADSLMIPHRPIRPERPERRYHNDTLTASPLFDK